MPKTKEKTKETSVRFSTALDFSKDDLGKLTGALEQLMADNLDLHSQTKFAHWNVKGRDFYSLHLLFDDLAAMIHPFTDTLAERITLLGGIARGSIRRAAALSTLEEFPESPHDGETYLRELQARYAEHSNNCRRQIEAVSDIDPTTEDMITELARAVDQALYFIEAHLQKTDS